MSLHEKYRPGKFSHLHGPARPIGDVLRKMSARGKLPHRVLLYGETGTGKTTLGRILARAVNCENLEEGDPCLECVPCRTMLTVREINAAEHTGIDSVREMIASMEYYPQGARAFAYLLDEIHMLSHASQNALLKPAEAPDPYVYMIFCSTEPSKLIRPLVNRLNRYELRRFTDPQISYLLQGVVNAEGATITESVLGALTSAASGCPRAGLTELEKVLGVPEEQALRMVSEAPGPEPQGIRDLCRLLMRRTSQWRDITDAVEAVVGTMPPEAVRLGIIGYLKIVLASDPANSLIMPLASAIHRLSEPLHDKRPEAKLLACITYAWADLRE